MTLGLLGYQLYIEFWQIKQAGILSYASDIVNWIDILQYIPTAWIVFVQMIGW